MSLFKAVVPKLCSADPKGSATSSQGIRGYISVMVTLKFTYFFNSKNNVLLKTIANFFNWRCVYFVRPLEYLIKKPPVYT